MQKSNQANMLRSNKRTGNRISFIKSSAFGWVPVAHACNSSYSGDRGTEERGSKPSQSNSSRDPISKNPSQK
jgi:hypothetical protein